MKRLPLSLFYSFLIWASALGLSAAAEGNHLFILSGQSNMAGLDPEISFSPAVENTFGKENVTVVHDARGGQPIRRWYKDWKPLHGEVTGPIGDSYDRLMGKVETASIGKEFSTITFVWMQGERDAREQHGEVYADSFKGLLRQLEKDLGREDLNFVIGRLSDFDMLNEKYPHWTMVRDIQVKLAESNARGAWVNTDDLNDGLNKGGQEIKDDLHYSEEGYRIFGERLAKAAISLIEKNETQPKSQAAQQVSRMSIGVQNVVSGL